MYCELLQSEVTTEACEKCWKSQMEEITREYEASGLLVGKPRTIMHEMCRKENLLERSKQ